MANFSEDKINAVWSKAQKDEEYDENEHRKDACGAWIARSEYGKQTEEGWDIDHSFPLAMGGDNSEFNLQALHWRNNRSKADSFPEFKGCIVAKGETNVEKEQDFTFEEALLSFKKLYPNNPYLSKL